MTETSAGKATVTVTDDSFSNDVLSSSMPVLVDFWATWCKPCVKMMPRLQELHAAWVDSGFVVLGVSIDETDESDDRAAKVATFTAKHGIRYPVCVDSGETPAWSTYRVKAVPAMFLIDREGNIVAQWTGEVDGDVVAQEVERVVGRH